MSDKLYTVYPHINGDGKHHSSFNLYVKESISFYSGDIIFINKTTDFIVIDNCKTYDTDPDFFERCIELTCILRGHSNDCIEPKHVPLEIIQLKTLYSKK